MYYPNKRNRYYVQQRRNEQKGNHMVPINGNMINGMFKSSQPNRYALRDGRVHCAHIEKTAIMTDRNGNRVVLREDQTFMNSDKYGPGIQYRSGNRRIRKKPY